MPKRDQAMTAGQYNAALRRLDLTPYAAAKVLGISLRQSHRYAADETPVPPVVAKLVRAYVKHGMPEKSDR